MELPACDPQCPVAVTAGILDGKWTSLIIRDLLSGKKRYNELQKSLKGISPRMLAMRLTELVSLGLVQKTIYPTVPPRTEYVLLPKGERLLGVIAAMAEYGAFLLDTQGDPQGNSAAQPLASLTSASAPDLM